MAMDDSVYLKNLEEAVRSNPNFVQPAGEFDHYGTAKKVIKWRGEPDDLETTLDKNELDQLVDGITGKRKPISELEEDSDDIEMDETGETDNVAGIDDEMDDEAIKEVTLGGMESDVLNRLISEMEEFEGDSFLEEETDEDDEEDIDYNDDEEDTDYNDEDEE